MDATNLARLVDQLRMLPANGAGRDRRLHRLTDGYAAAEAASALQAAAVRTREDAGTLSGALSMASALWDGSDDGPAVEDLVAQDRLRGTVSSPAFLSLVPSWIHELRHALFECATSIAEVETAIALVRAAASNGDALSRAQARVWASDAALSVSNRLLKLFKSADILSPAAFDDLAAAADLPGAVALQAGRLADLDFIARAITTRP